MMIHGGCIGGKLSPLYKRWAGIKGRCCFPANNKFKEYGARGITMCLEWRESFSAFEAWSLANGFRPELQIDRIDNSKGYSPDNCRWVSSKINVLNQARCIKMPNGESTADAARRIGITRGAMRLRMKNSGLTPEQAATLPKTPNGYQRKTFGKKLGLWKEEKE